MTKVKVVFAPGSLDSFEGTQEELDEMVAQIKTMLADGIPDDAIPVTLEEEEEMQRLFDKQEKLQ
jgi:hypothetical protein